MGSAGNRQDVGKQSVQPQRQAPFVGIAFLHKTSEVRVVIEFGMCSWRNLRLQQAARLQKGRRSMSEMVKIRKRWCLGRGVENCI